MLLKLCSQIYHCKLIEVKKNFRKIYKKDRESNGSISIGHRLAN